MLEESLVFYPRYRVMKRFFDLLIAIPSLVFLSPLMILIALIVRLNSRGNPLFSQIRIGRNGKFFTMYKIRTLYIEHFGHFIEQEEPNAYRITKVGKHLRRSKLDEIPQLINVILGHMSIVGPRPDIPLHLPSYTTTQHTRFLIKPGLTGLAQVSGNTLLSWPERILLDVWYMQNWNYLLDIKIILLTFIVTFKGRDYKPDPFNLHHKLLEHNTITTD